MSIIKKSSFPLHLDVFKVFTNDTDPDSKYFKITQLNDTLTGGKNAFLIQGTTYLRGGSYIFVEVKDSTGQVIYSEPAGGSPSNYYEGVTKPVSIHVYEDTLFGPATITVVGELNEWDDDGITRPIPDQWKGKINVKWQKTLNVNPFLVNTTPIRLYRRPKIEITEDLLGIYTRTNTQVAYSGYFRGVAIFPPANTEYPYNGPIRYEVVSINPTSASFISNTPTLPVSAPAVPFRKESVGLPLTIQNDFNTNIVYDVNGLPISTSHWQPIITSLIDPYRAIVDIPFFTLRNGNDRSKIQNIALGAWQTTYESSTVDANPTLSSSYASIDIKDLETFSGDIYRLKVFAKSRNDLQGFSLLDDIVLEENELLQTEFFEGEINKKTGDFTSANVITNYWEINNTSNGTGNASLSQTDNLINCVLLTGSNPISSGEKIFSFTNTGSINFDRGVEYILSFNSVFTQSPFTEFGLLEIYVTGSAFNDDNITTGLGLGKKIATLSASTFRRFEKQSINFKSDNTGDGKLSFWITNGDWELSDISLKAASQTAFNPSELSLLVKPNVQIPSESFDFRFEMFDINYTYVPITLEKTLRFGGGNDIIPSINLEFYNSGSNPPPSNPPIQIGPTNVSGLTYNAIFTVSPTAISASPEGINITASLNIVDPPLTFDSSSSTAYDRDGVVIQISDVEPGYSYPGFLTNMQQNESGYDRVFSTLTYANFQSKLTTPGRQVGRIDYNVFKTTNPTLATNTFRIGANYENYIGCTTPVIQSVTTMVSSSGPPVPQTTLKFTIQTDQVHNTTDTDIKLQYRYYDSSTNTTSSWFALFYTGSVSFPSTGRETWVSGTLFNPSGQFTVNQVSETTLGFNDQGVISVGTPSYNYGIDETNSETIQWYEFRIKKRCFGDTGNELDWTSPYRMVRTPQINFRTGSFGTTNITSYTAPGYAYLGPVADWSIFNQNNYKLWVDAQNLPVSNGWLTASVAPMGNFEICQYQLIGPSCGLVSDRTFIPYSGSGANLIGYGLPFAVVNGTDFYLNSINVRLKAGLNQGTYSEILTLQAPDGLGGNLNYQLPIQSTVGPPGMTLRIRWYLPNNASPSYNSMTSGSVRVTVGATTYSSSYQYTSAKSSELVGAPYEEVSFGGLQINTPISYEIRRVGNVALDPVFYACIKRPTTSTQFSIGPYGNRCWGNSTTATGTFAGATVAGQEMIVSVIMGYPPSNGSYETLTPTPFGVYGTCLCSTVTQCTPSITDLNLPYFLPCSPDEDYASFTPGGNYGCECEDCTTAPVTFGPNSKVAC